MPADDPSMTSRISTPRRLIRGLRPDLTVRATRRQIANALRHHMVSRAVRRRRDAEMTPPPPEPGRLSIRKARKRGT
jgi:hypothetical protein